MLLFTMITKTLKGEKEIQPKKVGTIIIIHPLAVHLEPLEKIH